MSFFEILLAAVALSVDAFILAGAVGLASRTADIVKRAVYSALVFSIFSAAAHVVGHLLAELFDEHYHRFAKWVAAALFLWLGIDLIINSIKHLRVKVREIGDVDYDYYTNKRLLLLALATAPDEFAAGVSLGAAGARMWLTVTTATAVTFAFTLLGVFLARRIGARTGPMAGIFAGAVLVGMALSTAIK